jgi:hypothetical protein
MKERKRYKVIDKHSGPIPLFTREYTIDDFPFLRNYFCLSHLMTKFSEQVYYQTHLEYIEDFLRK